MRWLVVVIALAACGHGASTDKDTGAHPMDPTKNDAQAAPKTTLEQVQRKAPQGTTVSDAGFGVPGVEVFRIADHAPLPQDAYPRYTYVAIVGGVGSPILEGDAVLQAVAKATPDAKHLAELAIEIGRPGMLLEAPRDDVQKKRGVTAPAIANGALDYWFMTGSPSLELAHGHLDLASGKLDVTFPEPGEDEVIADLAARVKQYPDVGSLNELAKKCANSTARAALFDVLASHAKDEMRWRAAAALQACGAVAVDPLIAALADKSSDVRVAAAMALGQIGDARARPALEKAAKSTDSALAAEATAALKKLH
jgi:hypothetical protein